MNTANNTKGLSVLLIGSGVIGSVYAGQLVLGGCQVWVLDHSEHDQKLVDTGIRLHDSATGRRATAAVSLARNANERAYDVVIVAVQAEQLPSTFPILKTLKGEPHIMFFGNNPNGHSLIPKNLPGDYELAFPGIAGGFEGDCIEYIHVNQQSTMIEASDNPLSKTVESILESQGFAVERTPNMDGWLMYHAVFIACMLAALRAANNSPASLGQNRPLLNLLCRAIEEGFAALKSEGVQGLPSALAILHLPILRPIAVHYWGNIMRSGRGDLYFAAHARRASKEVETLRQWVLKRLGAKRAKITHLQELLDSPWAADVQS